MNNMNDLLGPLLITPPGNLIYHTVLIFSIISALQSAFNQWQSSEYPQARRAITGLIVLFAFQFLMFALSGIGWQKLINSDAVLPPLDRGFTLLSIIWITWLWAFPEPSRSADGIVGVLSMLVSIATGLAIVAWAPSANAATSVDYNSTLANMIWQISALFFIGVGALLLFIRKPDGQWFGLAFLLVAFAGHAGQLLINPAGYYPSIVRIAYIAAYPILWTLPQRFSSNSPAPSRGASQNAKENQSEETNSSAERRRYSTDPKTFHAMLALAAETNPTKVSQAITRATAQTMLSDLCFLIYLTDNNNQTVLAGGYDLIREENLEGGVLNKSVVPMLASAIQRGRPLRLPASSTSTDIKGLADLLGITNPGHLLNVPILTQEKEPIGSVLLLSPYSNRLWTAEDQAFLTNIATALVPIIQRSQHFSRIELKSEQASLALEDSRAKMQDLERRNQELSQAVESASQAPAAAEDMVSLIAVQEESQRIIDQLKAENEILRNTTSDSSPAPASNSLGTAQLELELRDTLKELARLQNQLADASIKIDSLENGQAASKSTEQAEIIASISQELRQPMSSIVGYTDLLLGESIGILGALQRKFVERIKSSSERMKKMIDDMIQLTNLETGLIDLNPEPIDINLIIDNAMSYTSSQIREKNITIHLDLPKRIPAMHTDREAMQQILVHLLQNAGAASPAEGTIRLKVEARSEEDGIDLILLQVTDTGGGILAEDLPRVFTRLYRADNVLIQGVGDTGIGLSIAKSLTEAQNGRIWVESEAGSGATFSVLLPVDGDIARTKAKGKK